MWQETIQIEGPYNFNRVLERHAIDPLKQVDFTKRTIKVPILIKNSPFVVEVTALGTVEEPIFKLIGKNANEDSIKRISEIFQWGISLKKIHTH
ncbi:MAG: DNA-3-methyladenine glycosylase 2 family protein, partial [Bacillota bacterium]|nr:DNA-3-methyladenine glycosylase 2 family protein [Bacillota bacterium]